MIEVTPNNDAKRPPPRLTQHNKGIEHGSREANNEENLEEITAKPQLDLMARVVRGAQQDAEAYYTRNSVARDYLYARWKYQTVDGRKWGPNGDGTGAWPWAGASDTRVRLVEKLVGQATTVAKYALMNQKVQVRSIRPAATAAQSAAASTLLNWVLFVQMAEDNDLEHELALNWRHAMGCAVVAVEWEQTRRLEYVPVSLAALQQKAEETGDTQRAAEFTEALFDPVMEEQMLDTIQQLAPGMPRSTARTIANDLRDGETAEVPVPYVLRNQPRHTTLRPLIDVFFPLQTGNLKRARWIDRVEWLPETELIDRIETDGYDKQFVEEAIEQKGRSSVDGDWRKLGVQERAGFDLGTWEDEEDDLIELHHFYRMAHKHGTPCQELTVFHLNIDDKAAKHGPAPYKHGEYCFHGLRFEKLERAILSSRGIPEIAYTWESEIKEQRDGRTDRTALALRPPLFADYDEVLKLKMAFQPGAIYPKRRNSEVDYFKAPPWDQGSIEIERAVELTAKEHFGWFGNDVDPELKQFRKTELGDTIMMEYKPIIRQTWQLTQEYIGAEVVLAVTGKVLPQATRDDIQGQHDITGTIDYRDADQEWVKEKLGYITSLAGMDRAGRIDWSEMIQIGFEMIDYTIADRALKPAAEVTNKEIEDEIDKVSKIVGSGIEQPMPEGGNYQLRLQTLQNTIQSSQSAQMALKQDEKKLEVLQNRVKFFQFQLQQIQNAQVGRMGVQAADGSGEAPMAASPMMGMAA